MRMRAAPFRVFRLKARRGARVGVMGGWGWQMRAYSLEWRD